MDCMMMFLYIYSVQENIAPLDQHPPTSSSTPSLGRHQLYTVLKSCFTATPVYNIVLKKRCHTNTCDVVSA